MTTIKTHKQRKRKTQQKRRQGEKKDGKGEINRMKRPEKEKTMKEENRYR